MNRLYKFTLAVLFLLGVTASCTKDLDVEPIDPNSKTANNVFNGPEDYKAALAKLYASFILTGQQGPAGNPDISGIDEGFSSYLRVYFNAQELSTDEAVMAWNDNTIKDYHWMTWTASDVFNSALYNRVFYTISVSNEFIRQTQGKTEYATFEAEARFIRALAYFHAMDLFGNVPFVTEDDAPGTFYPEQIDRLSLFSYVESELLAIQDKLGAPRFEYGRADQGACWALLAKLYLNAEVYTGTPRYDDAITYSKKVIGAGYTLAPQYKNNFCADNNTSPEIIFSINSDGANTQTYGGTTFIVHAAVGGDMVASDFGIGSGWGGIRTTKALVYKFDPEAVKAAQASRTSIPFRMRSYPVIYVPGAHQGWDPATAPQLASVNSDGTYEGYVNFKEALNQFKFTEGPNWDANWGDTGADGTLDAGGDNIVAAEAGYYKLNVDLNAKTYSVTKTDWGVIGNATAGGWDSDQNLTYDAETDTWSADLNLTVGEIKFRANDGWDINLGDNGADGTLEAGGANIAIAEAGEYKITLKLGTPDYAYTIVRASYDHRAMFWSEGQTLEIEDIGNFREGYAVTKWKNVNADGSPAINPHNDFVCTDFPLLRLADIYLTYAEAVIRGGVGGDLNTAAGYINEIRDRAYESVGGGNITSGQLSPEFILDERARELFWEGHRRTDLIRFGKFTGGEYLWPWKGKVKDGTSVDGYRNLYPIPSTDLGVNPNLKQNTGY
ncbi:MAG: RagB/SusD family nutrient uptake outer membrane protein [Sphingobacteriia bacterium]|nr:RagB/SusD family nutrient uptake outer membrane protein [Sphingobacteriia bacterium]